MDSTRWNRLREAFDVASELGPVERADHLGRLEGEDPTLAAELRAMLAEDDLEEARPPAPSDRPLPKNLGRYEIRDRLGEGGFGEVFRAYDPTLRREVAIKTAVLHDTASRARFRREAEIAAGLVHPRIVTMHDLGEIDGEPFLVQELLDGEDLSRLLERGEPASFAARCTILRDVTEGLSFAHARLVVHRDVKPDNVRVLPDGRAKLLDFGIARGGIDARTATLQSGQSGTALGTLAYLAPEVLRGEVAGPAADVWGLGALAFELFTFQPPFTAKSPAALVYDIAHGPLPRLGAGSGRGEELPAPFVSWVERCLDRDPRRRFADATEALQALDVLGRTPAAAASAPPRRAFRRRTALLISLLLLAALVAMRLTAPWRRTAAKQRLATAAAATSAIGPRSVAIDARPWGVVHEIVDDAGTLAPLPEDRRTPLAVQLPPRRWRIDVRGPDGVTVRSCEVDLAPDGPQPQAGIACRVFFGRPDVRGFLERSR